MLWRVGKEGAWKAYIKGDCKIRTLLNVSVQLYDQNLAFKNCFQCFVRHLPQRLGFGLALIHPCCKVTDE